MPSTGGGRLRSDRVREVILKPARIVVLAAALLMTVIQAGIAAPPPRSSGKPVPGLHGIWHKVYWKLGQAAFDYVPPGVVFDTKRRQLVRFSPSRVRFEVVGDLGPGSAFTIQDGPIPLSHSAIYDPPRDRIVVLAPESIPGEMGTFAISLGGSVESSRLVAIGASPNLAFTSAIYDPVGDRMIVYGGMDSQQGGETRNEVWSLALEGEARWIRLEPHGLLPSGRMNHAAVYDLEHRAMVVFGGQAEFGICGRVLDDTWILYLEPQPHWRRIPVRDEHPPARGGHAAVYDAHGGRMVVAGGSPVCEPGFPWSPQLYEDLWELSLAGAPRWRRMNPEGEPPPGVVHLFAYYVPLRGFADPISNRMIVTSDYESVLWTLDWPRALGTEATLEEWSVRESSFSTSREPSIQVSSRIWRGDALSVDLFLPQSACASLALFDIGGRRIWNSPSEVLAAGSRSVTIAVTRAPAGVYFLRLEASGSSKSLKIVRASD